jgi:hypothetical protein
LLPQLAKRMRDNAAVNLGASLEVEIDDLLVAVCESHPNVCMEENDPTIIYNVNLLSNIRMEVDSSDESEGDIVKVMRLELYKLISNICILKVTARPPL